MNLENQYIHYGEEQHLIQAKIQNKSIEFIIILIFYSLPDIATLDLQDRIIYRDFDRLSYVYNPIQTPQEIAYAIQQDFKRIHIEDIVSTYEELRVITNAFLNNFQFLNKLFELYSYPNHFILEEHLDALFSRLESTDIPFDYYNTVRRGEMEYIDNKYSRYEFFELIIRLFYHKNMIDDSAPLVQLISDGIKIFVKSIKKIFTSMTLDALLSNVYYIMCYYYCYIEGTTSISK